MSLFGKKETPTSDQYIHEVLGWQEDEIIITRGRDCELLYCNDAASKKLDGDVSPSSCKIAYARRFKNLCENCPCPNVSESGKAVEFEALDILDGVFSVRAKGINWIDGRPAAMLTLRDITEQRRSEDRLYHLAYMDQLTNIPNRRKFVEDFGALSKDLSAGKIVACVALFDLDNFKAINDTYGHNTGDVMLKRLTESITAPPDFRGTLYRLGGDEFVIILSDKAKRYSSDSEMKKHFTGQISVILRTYSVPNIDLTCTLSIGLAFAPEHGTNAAELLRKADIALYESKGEGRNRLTVFCDMYEKAKKFKDFYINIQPVLTYSGKTFGYELVERSGDGSEESVVDLSDFNRTLDALNLEDIDSGIRYFIRYSEHLLSPSVLNNLPADKFIIQLDASKHGGSIDIGMIGELRKNKYAVALTGAQSTAVKPELLRSISFCRFDKTDTNALMQARIISSTPSVTFIAEGVNSQADFERARKSGFKLFQGYFFAEAPVKSRKVKELNPITANYFRLIKLTSTNDYVDFKEISEIISSDVSLSYKLLKLLNSTAVGLRSVSSISMAVAYLGEENLKKWVGLLALRGLGDSRPLELVRMSLIRARFGELIAPYIRAEESEKNLFLVGMLSLLHIAMEITREKLMEYISVADEIRDSLLTKDGPYSKILQFYEDYEYANWEEVSRFADEHNIDCQTINECYIAAVKWYNNLINSQ